MKHWELDETYGLINTAFGYVQLELARESIRSLFIREDYARYHFREMMRLTRYFERKHLKYGLLGNKSQEAFEQYIVKAGAHAVASMQSIHALPDILANAAYLASGQNLLPDALPEHEITMSKVINSPMRNTDFSSLVPILEKAQFGLQWKHLKELTNMSKHQSVVPAGLHEDFTTLRPKRFELRFQSFERILKQRSLSFQAVSVSELLESEYSRLATLIIEVGHELNACLRKNTI